MSDGKKSLTLLEKMKQKAMMQKSYGGEFIEESAKLTARVCPNCGAGRAAHDGLTHCAYCSFEFLSVKLTDGINIKKQDNSSNT
ncbi:hypothetical protein LZZ85_27170 [Terrimonas sp. NA20]|uniref:Uncharacterized protein n=1 Tax=Terrimonas ginsenosidimutans TaxID=2908004 RepID=A0ABS9L062_9BACT|nr:hypothetical protein [Terrimonas ginsenosidimutans]MCG2618014.1 hypothetical protein [Terrimonas ginsenosidimutans]